MTTKLDNLPPLRRDRLDPIARLCEQTGVKRLDVFGSALRDDFDPDRSDLDFVVEFKPETPRLGFAGPYFRLLAELKKLLGVEVDLVEYSAVRTPFFREELDEKRVPIYGS